MNVKLCWPAHSNAVITSSILFLTFKHENAILNVCLIVTLSPRIPDAKCLALWNYNKRLFIFITDLGTDNHYSTLEHCIFWCVQFYKPIILDDVYFMCVVCIISWGLPQIIIPLTKVLGPRPASGSPKRPDLATCQRIWSKRWMMGRQEMTLFWCGHTWRNRGSWVGLKPCFQGTDGSPRIIYGNSKSRVGKKDIPLNSLGQSVVWLIVFFFPG